MLANANSGQGFGIQVFEGFVLTRSLLETILIRVVLAGTVIKAFLDTTEGFQEEEDEILGSQLTQMKVMLDNITNMSIALQRRTEALE